MNGDSSLKLAREQAEHSRKIAGGAAGSAIFNAATAAITSAELISNGDSVALVAAFVCSISTAFSTGVAVNYGLKARQYGQEAAALSAANAQTQFVKVRNGDTNSVTTSF